jgi:hypothetical protein
MLTAVEYTPVRLQIKPELGVTARGERTEAGHTFDVALAA